MAEPARIAAITTTFFPNSHAGVLAAKFLTGFSTDEGLLPPRTRVASLYIDQIHRNDVGLQCQVERRAGGETGVVAVTCLSGEDVWRAAGAGCWPTDLADAALAATNPGPDRLAREHVSDPHVFLLVDRDGTIRSS